MILDTMALLADENTTVDQAATDEEILLVIQNLEDEGKIVFNYEMLNIGGILISNAEAQLWKEAIVALLAQGGMGYVDTQITADKLWRIARYKEDSDNPPDEFVESSSSSSCSSWVSYSSSSYSSSDAPMELNMDFPLNLQFDEKDDRDYVFEFGTSQNINGYDYENEMSPVKSQGKLGSCVAFAAASMKEWQEQKEHVDEVAAGKRDQREKTHYDLSEQWIYYNCKKIDRWPNSEGTSIRVAMKVLSKIGVPTEEAWPYSDVEVGEPESWAHLIARWGRIKSYERIANIDDLKIALKECGPVIIGMRVYYGIFYTNRDGIVPDRNPGEKSIGGHAVCVVGYDEKKKLFKFKNSWGSRWGNDGYGYVSYNYAESDFIDMWLACDMSVTKEDLKGEVEELTRG
jgi:hypothetical protein